MRNNHNESRSEFGGNTYIGSGKTVHKYALGLKFQSLNFIAVKFFISIISVIKNSKRSWLAWSIVALFIASSCKKESDNFPDAVNFNLTIVDDTGGVIVGAKVYFFESENAYLAAVSSKNFSAASDSAVSAATGVMVNLEGGKEYWVYIEYFDAINNVWLSNAAISSKINKLDKSSEITAEFTISAVSGNISFWSQGGNKFPIPVKFANLPKDTIFAPMAAAPVAPNNPNAANFSVTGGVYAYYAIADNGCVFTGQVTVPNGGFVAVQLPDCFRGRVTFLAPSYNPVHGAITVNLDNNELVGTLSGTGTFACGTGSSPGVGTNFLSVTKDANTYTYQARSADNQCSWQGSFTINPNSDTCIVKYLNSCP